MDKCLQDEGDSGMMSDGMKIRAQIDAESVRNAMFVSGGGSVALLALLPSVLGTPLVVAVICALAIWLVSLRLAVVHSVLHSKRSVAFKHHRMSPPSGARSLVSTPVGHKFVGGPETASLPPSSRSFLAGARWWQFHFGTLTSSRRSADYRLDQALQRL